MSSTNGSATNHTPFRFDKMWLQHPSLRKVVEDHSNIRVVGCHMYILANKLKTLKTVLKVWNREVFGNIHLRVKNALALVENIQQCINDNDQTEALMAQEEMAQGDLLLALKSEEEFLKEKSRLNWQLSDDRNISYFHKIARIRHATKSMYMMRDGDAIILDQQVISNHVLEYFHSHYASENNIRQTNLISLVFPNIVSEGDKLILSNIPLNEDNSAVVFKMNGDGAPDPDRFGGCFFEEFWDIIDNDVCNSVLQFFNQGWILPNLNSNNVVLKLLLKF
ncbi:PREDICTED: uncharacterized protein LOC109340168 [Lupinus angustifolius]|uniref:uncharacterized protein LOC109340168 n=1 Tax=Lupinus angustifolius TaxID=3871 RepID=UPI00092F5A0A|nr:PREDICTED: uncharacterized protein LOC109340168 [Lupinus angustifolius]